MTSFQDLLPALLARMLAGEQECLDSRTLGLAHELRIRLVVPGPAEWARQRIASLQRRGPSMVTLQATHGASDLFH
jgi:hypothetical protein